MILTRAYRSLNYIIGIVFRPVSTLDKILLEKPMHLAGLSAFIYGGLVIIHIYTTGQPLSDTPLWLTLLVFYPIGIPLVWLSFSVIIYVVGRALGGVGSLQSTLLVTGFAFIVPAFAVFLRILLPGGLYFLLSIPLKLWVATIAGIAIQKVHNLSTKKAFIVLLALITAIIFVRLTPGQGKGDDNAYQVTTSKFSDFGPSWSLFGSSITFSSNRSGNYDIWMIDQGGGEAYRLTEEPEDAYSPAWSPDEKWIAYIVDSGSPNWYRNLVIQSMNGLTTVPVTEKASFYNPSWSPDGTKVACSGGDPSGLWIIPVFAGGGNPIYLNVDGESPSWSPDGKKIAFVLGSGTNKSIVNEDIFVIPAEGGKTTQITTNKAWDRDPCWSPDGTKLAFASKRSGNFDIWVIDIESGVATQVTFSQAMDRNPAWSPDGKRIAFTSKRSGNRDIWVIDVAKD